MKTLILAAILALPTTMTFAGSCDHSWQSAKDGAQVVVNQKKKAAYAAFFIY